MTDSVTTEDACEHPAEHHVTLAYVLRWRFSVRVAMYLCLYYRECMGASSRCLPEIGILLLRHSASWCCSAS
jgi:hypothetical protein